MRLADQSFTSPEPTIPLACHRPEGWFALGTRMPLSVLCVSLTDDIIMLTECSKGTGQKEREILAKETQLLHDLADSLDEDDAPGKSWLI